jgi:DNA-directed RNA polymerase subunit RPC12/RpoP
MIFTIIKLDSNVCQHKNLVPIEIDIGVYSSLLWITKFGLVKCSQCNFQFRAIQYQWRIIGKTSNWIIQESSTCKHTIWKIDERTIKYAEKKTHLVLFVHDGKNVCGTHSDIYESADAYCVYCRTKLLMKREIGIEKKDKRWILIDN